MHKPSTQTLAVLEKAQAIKTSITTPLSINQLRSSRSLYGYTSTAPIKQIIDLTIDVTSGSISLRLFIPHGEGPFPVFINLHGGGWALGNITSNAGECQDICHQATSIVVTVDYRLAPEHKFPIPFNDCYEATEWVIKNISTYNGNPQQIVIGGYSAGGNLAAAVALKARDHKAFILAGQILVAPALDCRFDTESYNIYGTDYMLTTAQMEWFWSLYLKNEEDKQNPLACPLQASSFALLPKALILTAEFDPLRDDSYAYAQALNQANVPVIQKTYPSIHGFISMVDRIDEGMQAITLIADFLRTTLGK